MYDNIITYVCYNVICIPFQLKTKNVTTTTEFIISCLYFGHSGLCSAHYQEIYVSHIDL